MELTLLLDNLASEIERLANTEMDIKDRKDTREGILHLYEIRIKNLFNKDYCKECMSTPCQQI